MSEIKIFEGTPYLHNEQWCFSVDKETWERIMGIDAYEKELNRRMSRPSTLWLLFLDDLVPKDKKNKYRFKVTMEKL